METTAVQLLNRLGIKPSPQRTAVVSYLMSHKTHPTVDMVFSALSPDYPTLSRTTVYSTLQLLYTAGAAQKIVIEEGEMRFDGDIRPHGHFKCTTCGQVFDFFFDSKAMLPGPPPGFLATEQHLYYKGRCADCITPRQETPDR